MTDQLRLALSGSEFIFSLSLLIIYPVLFFRNELLLSFVEILRTFGAVSSLGFIRLSNIRFKCTFLHFIIQILLFSSSLELGDLSISILFIGQHAILSLISNILHLLIVLIIIWFIFCSWCTITPIHDFPILFYEVLIDIWILSSFSRFRLSFEFFTRNLVKSHIWRRIHCFITLIIARFIKLISVWLPEHIIDLNVCHRIGIELLRGLWNVSSLIWTSLILISYDHAHTFIHIYDFSIVTWAWISKIRSQVGSLSRHIDVTSSFTRIWRGIALVPIEVILIFHLSSSHLWRRIRFSMFL